MKIEIAPWMATVAIATIGLIGGMWTGYKVLDERVSGLETELTELRAEHDALHEQFTNWRIKASEGRGKAKAAGVQLRRLDSDVREDIGPAVEELLLKYQAFLMPIIRQEIRARNGVWPAVVTTQ